VAQGVVRRALCAPRTWQARAVFQSFAPVLARAAQHCIKPTGAPRLGSGGDFVVVVGGELRSVLLTRACGLCQPLGGKAQRLKTRASRIAPTIIHKCSLILSSAGKGVGGHPARGQVETEPTDWMPGIGQPVGPLPSAMLSEHLTCACASLTRRRAFRASGHSQGNRKQSPHRAGGNRGRLRGMGAGQERRTQAAGYTLEGARCEMRGRKGRGAGYPWRFGGDSGPQAEPCG